MDREVSFFPAVTSENLILCYVALYMNIRPRYLINIYGLSLPKWAFSVLKGNKRDILYSLCQTKNDKF